MSFDDALNAEEERLTENWAWGWFYVRGGLYAEQVKAYTEKFERVLVLLFEEDIVTGRATKKILNFLNLDSVSEVLENIQTNTSGYPKNRLVHRVTTRILGDEILVRKIKDMFKMTPFYAGSRRIYRKILEVNLKKEGMAQDTRQMLKEKFQDDVALLAEYTGLSRSEILEGFSVRHPGYPDTRLSASVFEITPKAGITKVSMKFLENCFAFCY